MKVVQNLQTFLIGHRPPKSVKFRIQSERTRRIREFGFDSIRPCVIFCRLIPYCRHISVNCWQRASVYGHLHGPGPATDRQPVSGLVGHCRPVRRRAGHDFCSGQRSTGLLDVRCQVLRYMDRH